MIDMSMNDGKRESTDVLESFSAVSRCLRSAAGEAYAAFDVGNTQAKLLRYIDRRGRSSQAELARVTMTDPALTGRTLEALISRGWVKRTRSEEDRREYLLELTASGQRARKRVEQARAQIARRMAAALDSRDVADLQRVTTKVLAAFER
jgi:DNA-binding MarR family transcriptional regulator